MTGSAQPGADIEEVAKQILQRLEGLLSALDEAAKANLAQGQFTLEGRTVEIRRSESLDASVACFWKAEDCLDLMEEVAQCLGFGLEAMDDFRIKLPEVEFEPDLVTGSFESWRGISVKRCNPVEELLSILGKKMSRRGIELGCLDISGETYLVFSVPRYRRQRGP
ncbi:MAG: hypothetical protein A4E45_00556 [Methanosaeta sp. PtaB.Bin039]|nr:MAG: hypothetical protein A4E45_00556 [Methanosaeta sp. PtaB.Bin039]